MPRCTAPTCVPPVGAWKRRACCIPSRAPNLQLSVETDAGDALDALLAHAGFSAGQAQELRWHRIRWPLTGDEGFEQRYGNY